MYAEPENNVQKGAVNCDHLCVVADAVVERANARQNGEERSFYGIKNYVVSPPPYEPHSDDEEWAAFCRLRCPPFESSLLTSWSASGQDNLVIKR